MLLAVCKPVLKKKKRKQTETKATPYKNHYLPYKNYSGIGAALVSKISNGFQTLHGRRCSDV